jgi:hypothetical protein
MSSGQVLRLFLGRSTTPAPATTRGRRPKDPLPCASAACKLIICIPLHALSTLRAAGGLCARPFPLRRVCVLALACSLPPSCYRFPEHSPASPACLHPIRCRRTHIPVHPVRVRDRSAGQSQTPREVPPWGQALHLRPVPGRLRHQVRPGQPPPPAHGRAALRVQPVPRDLHQVHQPDVPSSASPSRRPRDNAFSPPTGCRRGQSRSGHHHQWAQGPFSGTQRASHDAAEPACARKRRRWWRWQRRWRCRACAQGGATSTGAPHSPRPRRR